MESAPILDEAGLEAAVRECARITAPDVSDAEFEHHREMKTPQYLVTRDEMTRVLRAYFAAAGGRE